MPTHRPASDSLKRGFRCSSRTLPGTARRCQRGGADPAPSPGRGRVEGPGGARAPRADGRGEGLREAFRVRRPRGIVDETADPKNRRAAEDSFRLYMHCATHFLTLLPGAPKSDGLRYTIGASPKYSLLSTQYFFVKFEFIFSSLTPAIRGCNAKQYSGA